MQKVTWYFSGIPSYGFSNVEFNIAVEGTWSRFFESIADVKFSRLVSAKRANIVVTTKEIYLGRGTHARGLRNGRNIWLHSGEVSAGHSLNRPDKFFTKVFASQEDIQQVLAHEFGHYLGWGGERSHCRIPTCTFSSNAGVFWCDKHLKMVISRFGKRRQMEEFEV